MIHIDRYQLRLLLEKHAREGREIQLYGPHGQYIYPCFSSSGALLNEVSLFPILRGKGDRAPKFEGAFPDHNGQIIDLGEDWKVICVKLRGDFTFDELKQALEQAETEISKEKTK